MSIPGDHTTLQYTTQPPCRNLKPMTIAKEVKALRAALGESAATFAARWHRSPRTVETWEQGTRQPDPLVLEGMRALAARTTKARAKKARG
jgi:DNA-binding transcriptional regulator YiaG